MKLYIMHLISQVALVLIIILYFVYLATYLKKLIVLILWVPIILYNLL